MLRNCSGSILKTIRCFNFSALNHGVKPLLMAALSPTMEKGNIVEWNFKEGDFVEAGSSICEIETDKAIIGMDAIDDCVLAKIVQPEGAKEIPLGTLIGWTAEKDDDLSTLVIPKSLETEDNRQEESSTSEQSTSEQSPTPEKSSDTVSSEKERLEDDSSDSRAEGKIKASLAVRALINKHKIDALKLTASGPRGSITKKDVENYLLTNQERKSEIQSEYTDIPVNTVRGIVASRLSLSKQTIPHEYCSISCQMNNVLKLREEIKELNNYKVSINDFVIKATALSLKMVPKLNGVMKDGKIELRKDIDIAVAVSIPDGLITPVLKKADSLSLEDISNNVKELATKARNRRLAPEEFQNSTFTVSNLGMYGIDSFSAVINPPELGILAIGGTRNVGLSSKEMTVTLSYDIRAIEPVVACKFLKCFKAIIENPEMLEM